MAVDDTVRESTAPPRSLGLVHAANARDVGGYPTADGRRVVTGRVFRSDGLGRLTDEEVAVLAGHGVVTVVDLRSYTEVAALGADRLPAGAHGVHLPVFDPDADLYRWMAELIASRDPDRQRAELAGGAAERYMTGLYGWFVVDDGARQRFGTLLRRISDAAALPLLFHCTAGKDRTGWTAAILLTLLGVDRAVIDADYLASNGLTRTVADRMLSRLGAAGGMAEPELLRPLLDVRPGYLAAAFAAADARFGSFDAFVTDGLGLDASHRERLADLLLTDR